MKIKRIIFITLLILGIFFILKSCIKADRPEKDIKISHKSATQLLKVKYPGPYKTITINNIEYREARGELGKFGGTLNVSSIGEGPKTFNPWNAKDASSSDIGSMMFDGLVTTDAYTGEVIPQMAKSFTISKDGKQYIFVLRKGLKWSDGKPITAQDIIFTFNDIIAAGFGNTSMRDNMMIAGQMPTAQAIDNLTVKFTTPKPFAPFLRQLGFQIAPKHILEPVIKQGKQSFESFWGVTTPPNQIITSGMFKLQRYIPAQRVEMIRNPNYYMVDQKGRKLPYLDKYITNIVGDVNNQTLKFEAGEIDALDVRGSEAARFKALEKRSNYNVFNLGPDSGTMFLTFNLNNRKSMDNKPYVDPKKQKWFNDINFRTAVDYTLDRESIVANILNGVGAPLFTSESLCSIYLDPKLKNGHVRNVKLARELLAKSGFKWNKQGKLYDKSNNLVEFTLYTNAGNTERESTGVMIKQDLEELGIKVDFKPIEFNVLVGKLVGSYDWDAVVMGLTGSPLDPYSGKNVWYSQGALHMFNQRSLNGKEIKSKNDVRPWEKELDNIFDQAAQTIDNSKRKEIYYKYQELVYKEKPFIYIYSALKITAIRKKFGNLHPTPLGGSFHNLEEIYIKVPEAHP